MTVLHWPKLFEGLICPDGDVERNGWGAGYGYSFSGGGDGSGVWAGRGSGEGNGLIVGDGRGCSIDGDNYGGGENTFI
jgi:hypothetical protein